MGLPSTTTSPNLAVSVLQLQNLATSIKSAATNAITILQAGPVSTSWTFSFLDQCIFLISGLDKYKTTLGLNAYFQSEVPGYVGTITTDIAATKAAIEACMNWIVTNFPKDSTATYILAETLNADGTRTQRTFSTAQTAGLVTALQAVIATIS